LIVVVLVVLSAAAMIGWNVNKKHSQEMARQALLQRQVDWVTKNLDGRVWRQAHDIDSERVEASVAKSCSLKVAQFTAAGPVTGEDDCDIRLAGFRDDAVKIDDLYPGQIFVSLDGPNVSCRNAENGFPKVGLGLGFYTHEEAEQFATSFKQMAHDNCSGVNTSGDR
jgi:hypothetical protein